MNKLRRLGGLKKLRWLHCFLKKEELDKKKAEESIKMEEEGKRVIAVNDPKENVWTQFNDILRV